MPFYILSHKTTGAMVSQGTVVGEGATDAYDVHEFETPPDFAAQMWDAATRTLIPRPPAVRHYCSQVEFAKRIGLTTMTAVNMIRMDPATPLQLRAQLETLRQVMQDASRIELDDADTIAGAQLVASLAASAGLITNTPEAIATEAARILAPFPA